MEDRKRLNGEIPGTISKKDIEAWKRDKGQAGRNAKLKKLDGITTDQAIKVVKTFAQLGDYHHTSVRLGLEAGKVKAVLAHFKISSIEDAKRLITSGIIGELDRASANERDTDAAQAKQDHQDASARLAEHDAARTKPKKTQLEKDVELRELREDAQRKNKRDQIKSLIAQGLNESKNTSKFRIDLKDVAKFVAMIPHGLFFLQRQFGGSKKDIVSEIKRLSPTTDINVLRP